MKRTGRLRQEIERRQELLEEWKGEESRRSFDSRPIFYPSEQELISSELGVFYVGLMKKCGTSFSWLDGREYLTTFESGPERGQFLWSHSRGFALGLPQIIIPSQFSWVSIFSRVNFERPDCDLALIGKGVEKIIGARKYVEDRGYEMNWRMDSATCTFTGKCSSYIPVTSRKQIADIVRSLND